MLKSERIHVARRDAIRNMIMHSRGLEPGGTGLAPDRIRYILRNPLYNGWVRWHWGAAETRRPAASCAALRVGRAVGPGRGRPIVSVRLTPAAHANGLALALPQVVMARPEGLEPPTL